MICRDPRARGRRLSGVAAGVVWLNRDGGLEPTIGGRPRQQWPLRRRTAGQARLDRQAEKPTGGVSDSGASQGQHCEGGTAGDVQAHGVQQPDMTHGPVPPRCRWPTLPGRHDLHEAVVTLGNTD